MASNGHIGLVLSAIILGGVGIAAKTCGKTARHLDDVARLGSRHLDDTSRLASKGDGVSIGNRYPGASNSVVAPKSGTSKSAPYEGEAARVAEELAMQGGEQILAASLEGYAGEKEGSTNPNSEITDNRASEPQTILSAGRTAIGFGEVLLAIGLFLTILLVINVLSPIWIFYCSRWLGVPPLQLTVGVGPKLYSKRTSGVDVTLHALPISHSSTYQSDKQVAAALPGIGARAVLMLVPIVFLLLLAIAILGASALQSFANGFFQVAQVAWPSKGGVDLVTSFAEFHQSQGTALALGLLSTKFAAASLLATLFQPMLWRGVREHSSNWLVVLMLIPMLAAIGVLISILRAAF